jgi:hypothetical protein
MTGRNNKRLRNGRAQKEGSQQNLSSAVVETPAVVAVLQQNGSVNNETPVAARSATFTAAAAPFSKKFLGVMKTKIPRKMSILQHLVYLNNIFCFPFEIFVPRNRICV